MIRTLILAAALAVLSPFAQADTLKVPQDFETIQAAVDAAVAGDTVAISSGNYTENIVVPAGKDGLTITGKGKVFINGQGVPEADGGSGDGIRIESDDVTISKLAIRHADGAGIRATVGGGDGPPPPLSGLTIEKVTIINSFSAGIDVDADDCTVDNCLLAGNGNGLQIDGASARITKTKVLNDGDAGIVINGDDAVVDGCTVSAIEDGLGIEIRGERATVKKCSVSIVDGEGIFVTDGSGHLVENNRLESTAWNGIWVGGDDSVVQRNGVHSPCGEGIEIHGNNLRVASNTVTNVSDDQIGIVVFGLSASADMYPESAGSIIEKNKVIGAQEAGYNLRLLDSTVSKNLAQACGGEDDVGFRIRGDNNTIDRNTAKSGDDTGFEIEGSNNTLTKNKASDNTDNGIVVVVGSTGNILDGNNVSNNFGDGIQNEGVGTILRKNKIKGNLQDLSNETLNGANYVDEGGNSFSTGGLDSEPVVD